MGLLLCTEANAHTVPTIPLCDSCLHSSSYSFLLPPFFLFHFSPIFACSPLSASQVQTRYTKAHCFPPSSLGYQASLVSFLADLGFDKIRPLTPAQCDASAVCSAVAATRRWLEGPLEAWFVPVTLSAAAALRVLAALLSAAADIALLRRGSVKQKQS
jgi:hypothetical protein